MIVLLSSPISVWTNSLLVTDPSDRARAVSRSQHNTTVSRKLVFRSGSSPHGNSRGKRHVCGQAQSSHHDHLNNQCPGGIIASSPKLSVSLSGDVTASCHVVWNNMQVSMQPCSGVSRCDANDFMGMSQRRNFLWRISIRRKWPWALCLQREAPGQHCATTLPNKR
eukprot:scpid97262/ scgid23470/ 